MTLEYSHFVSFSLSTIKSNCEKVSLKWFPFTMSDPLSCLTPLLLHFLLLLRKQHFRINKILFVWITFILPSSSSVIPIMLLLNISLASGNSCSIKSTVTREISPRGEIFSFNSVWKKISVTGEFQLGVKRIFFTSFHPWVKIYLQRFAGYFTKMGYRKRRFVCS